MLRLLIFIFPAVMDMVIGTVFFVAPFRMAQADYSGFSVGALSATWAIVYSGCNLLSGRWVTEKNATSVMIASCLVTALAALGFIIFPAIKLQFIFVVLIGMAGAMFFQPFQLFMKSIEHLQPQGCLTRSTALYTFSWSFGMATGPFISAFIWHNYGWRGCYIMNIIMVFSVMLGIILVKRYLARRCDNPSKVAPVAAETGIRRYEQMPDIAWLGWVAAGTGFLTVALVKAVLPLKAERLHFSESELGFILATLSYVQAFTGLLLGFGYFWMYRITLPIIFTLCGIGSLLLFYSSNSVAWMLLAALAYGIYSGYFCFYFVFHSLVHPEKSGKYIATNEVIVGLTCIAGPLAGGLLADYKNPSFPFLAVIVPIIIVLTIQIIVKYRLRPI